MIYINGEAVAPMETVKEMHDYSTDEQVVGTWIDGKPLYEKTFYFNNKKITSSDNSSELIHGLSNIENGFIWNAFYKDTTKADSWKCANNVLQGASSIYEVMLTFGGTSFYAVGLGSSNIDAATTRSIIVIARYTKTTD